MEEEKKYSLSEAHHHFAVDFHGKTWDLLEKKDRNQDENKDNGTGEKKIKGRRQRMMPDSDGD